MSENKDENEKEIDPSAIMRALNQIKDEKLKEENEQKILGEMKERKREKGISFPEKTALVIAAFFIGVSIGFFFGAAWGFFELIGGK